MADEQHTEAAGPQEQPPSATPVGHEGARVDVGERRAWAVDGFLGAFVALVLVLGGAALAGGSAVLGLAGGLAGVGVLLLLAGILLATGLTIVQPGETKVLQFFGRYLGTTRRTGLSLVCPLTTKRRVSVRVNNFETNALKVNDADGNPVEVASIIVWQVADTARATFSVESYASFVRVQSEAAVRHVAGAHPYDDYTGAETTLRGSTDVVSAQLASEVAERVAVAGIEIVEVRISHLAYAPEIAQAMLQRQQAGAVVAARAQIVEGAVGMVETALARLESKDLVELDDERRASMVSNLLVVLCGDQHAQPVINAGSLYS